MAFNILLISSLLQASFLFIMTLSEAIILHPLYFYFSCPPQIFNFQTIADAIKPNTKIVWVESPTNPTLKITDIRSVADVVRSIRADM